MRIKTKLILGVGLLFVMIVLLTVLSIFYINRLSNDSSNILTDNYNTIDYCRQMLDAVNEGINKPQAQQLFRVNLDKQKNTITEPGEDVLTAQLERDFSAIRYQTADTGLIKNIQTAIMDIMLLNMQSIQRKSSIAKTTADASVFWISLVGVICFLLAFTMLVNLPGNVANPVKELTASIKQIAAQNYSQRVHFDQQNEFGELAAAFNSMAEKLEEYQAVNLDKLMVEKKRIEALINNMSEPVIGLNDRGIILFMNHRALAITGLLHLQVVGRPALEVAAYNDLFRTLLTDLSQKTTTEHRSQLPLVKVYADNKESYFSKEVIPIRIIPTGEKEEKHIGHVIILQNITPYKELDVAKTHFIATISHELKTPISSIKMSLQLLGHEQVGTLNQEQQELVKSIQEDAGRLLKITAELLNMAQVETGTIQIDLRPSSVSEIISYALAATRAAAGYRQISIDMDLPADIPLVLADSEKSAWVLTNLLSNAIRYSYDGARIFVKAEQIGEWVHFSVRDTGQGIPPEYIHRIFDRYFRIPGAKKEGTGLGLSISKEFIEAQGGTLNASSDYGAGSTFTFTLRVVNGGGIAE